MSGGWIGIGNCGIETEMFGAIDRVILLVGGSITKVPASYDRFLPTAGRSTGGRVPMHVASEVYDRARVWLDPMKPGECICDAGGDGRAGLTGPQALGETVNVV